VRETSEQGPSRRGPQEVTPREAWQRVSPGWVRSWELAPSAASPARATVLVVPGLGLPAYLEPTARAVVGLGMRCVVLDLLAGRRPPQRVAPTVDAMALAAAQWVDRSGIEGPLVLVGHSTGAQVALAAGLRLQGKRDALALLLAGLTFQPSQRTVAGVLRGAAAAYRRDSPRELVALRSLARVRGDVVRLVQSARRDEPEVRAASLRVPLTLTAGERDSFAPRAWMQSVADAAGGPSARVATLPGSHNNLFTHPNEFAALVAVAAAGLAPASETQTW
jgi:pimeloyl-ACP methyl ester carboxylesterase